MLKLLQYCNYIIIVMQIKLMLLLLLSTLYPPPPKKKITNENCTPSAIADFTMHLPLQPLLDQVFSSMLGR